MIKTHVTALLEAAPSLTPERAARVAWATLVEPSDDVAGSLIAAHGPVDALGVVLEDASSDIAGVDDLRQRVSGRSNPSTVVAAQRAADRVGAHLLTPGTTEWPTQLDDLCDRAPIVLWALGDVEILHTEQITTVVGARACTAYAETVTQELVSGLVSRGHAIASGAAYGVDGISHRTALAVGGKTIAAVAGGVDRFYPAGHDLLLARIAEMGVVISEMPCGSTPTKWRFAARNRILASLGARTVVVEAGARSGSLNTATYAATLGRPVGAVPGSILSSSSSGCHRLIREEGATLVTSVDDVANL